MAQFPKPAVEDPGGRSCSLGRPDFAPVRTNRCKDPPMAKTAPPPLDQVDPVKAWQPWEPDAANPWSLKWAGHLYRRAGFGATLAEQRQAVKDGLEATFDRLFRTDAEAEERY